MNNNSIKYILLFVLVVLIQVLFLNNVQFSGYVNPYFYIVFILMLPQSISRIWLLIFSFALGLTIDVFSNTPGIHASASVFLGFVRPFINNGATTSDTDEELVPSIVNIGLRQFAIYIGMGVLIHHLILFTVEVFSLHSFGDTLLRALLSAIFTYITIFISQLFIFRK